MKRRKPPYWKPPRDTCQLCGASLYRRPRYRVKLYIKAPRGTTLASTPYKTLMVCEACLARLRRDPQLARLFRARYKRLPTLGAPKKNPCPEIQSTQKKKNIA